MRAPPTDHQEAATGGTDRDRGAHPAGLRSFSALPEVFGANPLKARPPWYGSPLPSVSLDRHVATRQSRSVSAPVTSRRSRRYTRTVTGAADPPPRPPHAASCRP